MGTVDDKNGKEPGIQDLASEVENLAEEVLTLLQSVLGPREGENKSQDEQSPLFDSLRHSKSVLLEIKTRLQL